MIKKKVHWLLTQMHMLFIAQHELVQNKRIHLYRGKCMDATERPFFSPHCPQISEKGLSSLKHSSSLLFHLTCILFCVTSLLSQLQLANGLLQIFFSHEQNQIKGLQPDSISSRSSFYIMSSMFCFLRPGNKFNRFSLTTDFSLADMTVIMGFYF